MATDELIHGELSKAIIGCAMLAHRKLRPGLREKTHERALVLELNKKGLLCEQQESFDVFYDGEAIDTYIPDLIVADKVIVDAKCVTSFDDTHVAQMIGYLAITKLRLGLLINFKHARLQWKRIVN
ncbi:MAG: GxxExxY protein [Opitutae bacterium]|nr:GxxExxY protein [Opitutae bacterium]